MDDYTRKFDFTGEQDAEIHRIMLTVYKALEEKGYNPINQIVGYILSEDPTYITNHNQARPLTRKGTGDELRQTRGRTYLQKYPQKKKTPRGTSPGGLLRLSKKADAFSAKGDPLRSAPWDR